MSWDIRHFSAMLAVAAMVFAAGQLRARFDVMEGRQVTDKEIVLAEIDVLERRLEKKIMELNALKDEVSSLQACGAP